MFAFLRGIHLVLAGAVFLLIPACKQEAMSEATADISNQSRKLERSVDAAVPQTENNESITLEQKRIAREQDQLLEQALNSDQQQQRGDLAKDVKLSASYAQCVKNADAVMPVLMDCNHQEYAYQDARLNKVYARLLKSLPAEKTASLKQEERDWIKWRDTLCQSKGALGGGQAEELEDSSCELNATSKRAEELEKR
nr:lysozyme inhibitor LprI family protein [Xanthomonas vasicola]MDO6950168.1 lysozyme inhibitor LprI family protein [Xanthomonas vasicola]MDO6957975.1 lysozyme inhibitor LprI family protein [Xanthomonas vasicola]MDO6962146.1 lysozyme inhibitor LprI family protein [Xanthomonas vasicola]MDO6971082.1 lysozyme inhibitor LprI family protein [Xanthomonas vasicola]MDO6974990.1 lysozyme inhibitor LprI family protein [Xanthomonas vasicola]